MPTSSLSPPCPPPVAALMEAEPPQPSGESPSENSSVVRSAPACLDSAVNATVLDLGIARCVHVEQRREQRAGHVADGG